MANPEKEALKAHAPESNKCSEGSSLSYKQSGDTLKQVEKATSGKDKEIADKVFGKVHIEDSPIKKRDEQGRPTEFRYDDGSSRDVSYFPNGKIKEVKMGLPKGAKHGANKDVERLVSDDNGKTYQPICRNGIEIDTPTNVRISDSGTVTYDSQFGGKVGFLPNGDEYQNETFEQGTKWEKVTHMDQSTRERFYTPDLTYNIEEGPNKPYEVTLKTLSGLYSATYTEIGPDAFEKKTTDPDTGTHTELKSLDSEAFKKNMSNKIYENVKAYSPKDEAESKPLTLDSILDKIAEMSGIRVRFHKTW